MLSTFCRKAQSNPSHALLILKVAIYAQLLQPQLVELPLMLLQTATNPVIPNFIMFTFWVQINHMWNMTISISQRRP